MSKVALSSQSRIFHIVLYPDSTLYDTTFVLSDLVVNLNSVVQYAYCLHDKDLGDSGDLLKPHYHLVLKCKYPVKYSDVCTKLGLPESAINLPVSSHRQSFRSMVRYLIHADSPKKFQYAFEDIISNFSCSDYFDLSSSDDDSSAFRELLDFMLEGHPTKKSIALYACNSGLLKYYNRYYRILWDIKYGIDFSDNPIKKNFDDLCESIDKFNSL